MKLLLLCGLSVVCIFGRAEEGKGTPVLPPAPPPEINAEFDEEFKKEEPRTQAPSEPIRDHQKEIYKDSKDSQKRPVIHNDKPLGPAQSAGDDGPASTIATLIKSYFWLSVIWYFFPTLVSSLRGHTHSGNVFALNLLFGWTGIGWLLALVWACVGKTRVARSWWRSSGDFSVEVVGESYYQKALESICGGRTSDGANHHVLAQLILEDENPHDNMAVRVDIEGRTVGHLSREVARRYRKKLSSEGISSSCPAKIVGGWSRGKKQGYFGVKLNFPELA